MAHLIDRPVNLMRGFHVWLHVHCLVFGVGVGVVTCATKSAEADSNHGRAAEDAAASHFDVSRRLKILESHVMFVGEGINGSL